MSVSNSNSLSPNSENHSANFLPTVLNASVNQFLTLHPKLQVSSSDVGVVVVAFWATHGLERHTSDPTKRNTRFIFFPDSLSFAFFSIAVVLHKINVQ